MKRDTDRGEATTQVVILMPLLIFLVVLGVQTAIYFHAANVASAAASQGAAAGAPLGSGAGDAEAAARQTISDLAATAGASPVAAESTDFVSVTVEVRVPHIVPFFPDAVRRSAIEPRERFVPETDR
jgi:Flp pilus assembly protein TadG